MYSFTSGFLLQPDGSQAVQGLSPVLGCAEPLSYVFIYLTNSPANLLSLRMSAALLLVQESLCLQFESGDKA
jgi:hypothetical protein